MKGLTLACALASASGFRVLRKNELAASDVNVVCTYEHLSILFDEEEAEKRGQRETEIGECVAEDGGVYAVDPDDLEWAEHGDVLSLRLRPLAGISDSGVPMFKVKKAELVHREEANMSVQAGGRSVVAVGTTWSDRSKSATRSNIMSNVEAAKKMIQESSYGSFRFSNTAYLSGSVPKSWAREVKACNVGEIQRAVTNAIPKSKDHMYRMLFIPNEPKGCGWAGVAPVGCGKPGNSAKPGACWSMYRSDKPFVQAHELGHNFGLLHAGGERRGNYVTYGDPQAIMGNSNAAGTAFAAAARFQVGWLRERAGEVRTSRGGVFKLSVLTSGKNFRGADAVAVKFDCNRCVPKVENNKNNVGGSIFVSYGYGKVMVHLNRVNNKGTEHWAALGNGQGWRNPFGGNAVHVCKLTSTLATVAIDTSASAAKRRCR